MNRKKPSTEEHKFKVKVGTKAAITLLVRIGG